MANESKVEMTPVESSNVEAIGFCPDENCVHVTFKSGGTYKYPDCTPELFDQLKGAESVGKFVYQHLKPKGHTKL